jgi:hypothetical protein
MVVLSVYHDLDNDVHVHWIVPMVGSIHPYNHRIVVKMLDTLAFHDGNTLMVARVLVNTANET